MVTAFPNTSEADGGKPGKAKGLMKASEVSKRLEKHLAQTAEEGGELSEEIAEAKAELVELLGGLLTKQAERQLQRLDRVLAKRPPEKVLAAIQRAKDKAERGKLRGEGVIKEVKDKAGPPEGKGKPANSDGDV